MAQDRVAVDGVCSWFAENARALPWRGASAWGVMVSEFMLQQTPVTRVEPVWRAWMDRWPAPADLASARPGDAVRAWGRLGYPRRALRLHGAATVITRDFDGRVPDDADRLRTLPGVGDYTAAAICAFAFGQPTVVLDVNVRRVISRAWSGRSEAPAHLTAVERALARTLSVAATDPSVWAAASMELGALVCTRRNPQCPRCPLVETCRWQAQGAPQSPTPVRRQPRFEGSDRQARGRIMRVLREASGAVDRAALLAAADDRVQAERALASLVSDGLVVRRRGRFLLPD